MLSLKVRTLSNCWVFTLTNLKFDDHINNILKKANAKFYALLRVSKFMSHNKLRLLLKTFIESQFNYCPLIWMFHSRVLNKKLNAYMKEP